MSQTPKRPGTRDISELKARLGLKKAAPEKAPAAKQTGAVAPPPGLAVPAPQPKQTGPVVPAASDDPFGNMNAMAQIGTMQRAPEIVIVHDGKPVESVSTGTRAAAIGKYVAIGLIPLLLGWQIGAIGKSAAIYNDGIDDAKAISTNVKKAKKELSDLQSNLQDALKKSGGKYDPSITKVLQTALASATFKVSDERPDKVNTPDNSELVFRAKQNSLNSGLSGQILTFYSHIAELAQIMDEHVRAAKTDDLVAADAAAKAAVVTINGSQLLKYAVVLSNPSEDDMKAGKGGGFGAQLVEIGPAFCGDGPSQGGQCPGGAQAQIGYRTDPSGTDPNSRWTKGDIAQPGAGQPFPNKQLVVLAQTPILDSLVKGATPSASEVLYQRRLQQISSMIEVIIDEGNRLDAQLAPKANEGKKFSFFL